LAAQRKAEEQKRKEEELKERMRTQKFIQFQATIEN